MKKEWLVKHKKNILGICIGAISGFLYYRFVGCASGSCRITSNPFLMIPYGALLGVLFVGIFEKREDKKNNEIEKL